MQKEVARVTASKKGKWKSSPRKCTAVVSGLAKEVGLSIQNNYEKQCHGNPSLSDELKEAVKKFFFRSDI